jgi:beta-lactamase superfamily II metal-dependent hydrolase
MHLEGPWLSTTGKKKSKRKFRTAEHARKARDLDDSWQQLLKKYETKPLPKPKAQSLSSTYSLEIPKGRNTTAHIKSVDTGGGIAAKRESPKYTGTLIKGIATMHKSNAVPILNQEDAEAISKMRR